MDFVITNIDLQTAAIAWHAGVTGKSIGKLGRLKMFIRGTKPF